MCKEKKEFAPAVDFKEQTPVQLIGEAHQSEFFKKAWLENDAGVSNEFCQNTTSWD